jgi:hypothetical protein
MGGHDLRELERASYYAVVKALYACVRLETFVGGTRKPPSCGSRERAGSTTAAPCGSVCLA